MLKTILPSFPRAVISLRSVLCVGGKKPEDRTTVEPVLRVVSLSLYVCLSFVALLGILSSCLLLVFIYVYRQVGRVERLISHLQNIALQLELSKR